MHITNFGFSRYEASFLAVLRNSAEILAAHFAHDKAPLPGLSSGFMVDRPASACTPEEGPRRIPLHFPEEPSFAP